MLRFVGVSVDGPLTSPSSGQLGSHMNIQLVVSQSAS